jgi:cell shape-determining protein MreC
VSNIATFFKIPIYIVSIFFLIFIFLFITSLFRFLFKFLFKNHSLKLFTSDNPKTIIQEVVSNQNTYLMDIEKKNEDLIKENNFLKEEKKIYKLITKDLEALNRINNKLSINTKTYDDLLKQTDTKKH